MKTVRCSGSPFEIGFQHGESATSEIKRALVFYEDLFERLVKLSWNEACQEASKFMPFLQGRWPQYVDEIRGVSKGSGVPFESILALNARTEIAYGMFDDGCTALSWKCDSVSILAQNWDWQTEQAENLIRLQIRQESKPSIDMICEAGIIGKIGLNSAGVGVCLNAIQAKGVCFDRLPCHLALRACLDSHSKTEAARILQTTGVASSCHILVADPTGSTGLEFSNVDIVELPANSSGIVIHTNHYVKDHPGVIDRIYLSDSITRLDRIGKLVSTYPDGPTMTAVSEMLKDEENYPVSICRAQTEKSTTATLFCIVMKLDEKLAIVTVGRPVQSVGTLVLNQWE
ncbi:hypothetical protein MMC17_003288 [Xylographa soralifera]|nr:hypothetical protein [Xylographa soralifera]